MFEMMTLVFFVGVVFIAAIAIVAAVCFLKASDKRISDAKKKSKSWVDKEERS